MKVLKATDSPDPKAREHALQTEMAGVIHLDADAESQRPLFVPGYLVRIDVAALARNLSKQHDREFLQIHAACWLVMRVGLEESPFMATDEPDWFASYEAPESLLMGDELKAVETVPLSRLRGRGRLKVARLRDLAKLPQRPAGATNDDPEEAIDDFDEELVDAADPLAGLAFSVRQDGFNATG